MTYIAKPKVHHPSLKAKGAVDGVMLSGSAPDDNDHLARRDQGLEFTAPDDALAAVPAA